MKRYLLTAFAALTFVGSANAQNPADLLANDLSAIAGNLQPATEALAAGLQNTAAQLTSAKPAQNTQGALGDTVTATVSVLVDGTTDANSLRSGVSAIEFGFERFARPLLKVLDNPSTANVENLQNTVLNPNQLTTIAGNLQPAITAVWIGSGPGFFTNPNGTGGKAALLRLLEGDLISDGFFGDNGAVKNAMGTLILPVQRLFFGTHIRFLTGGSLSVVRLAPTQTTATANLLQQLEGPAMQLAEAANPVADPTGALIEQVEFDAGSLSLPSTDEILNAYGAGGL